MLLFLHTLPGWLAKTSPYLTPKPKVIETLNLACKWAFTYIFTKLVLSSHSYFFQKSRTFISDVITSSSLAQYIKVGLFLTMFHEMPKFNCYVRHKYAL